MFISKKLIALFISISLLGGVIGLSFVSLSAFAAVTQYRTEVAPKWLMNYLRAQRHDRPNVLESFQRGYRQNPSPETFNKYIQYFDVQKRTIHGPDSTIYTDRGLKASPVILPKKP